MAVLALVIITLADSWRTAAVAALAAAMIVATRIRFAHLAALALLIGAMLVIAIGGGFSGYERDPRPPQRVSATG